MNYVILSNGEYSDYDPTYFVGEERLTQVDFDGKGREVGDKILAWYKSLPVKPFSYGGATREKKYNPVTGEAVDSYDLSKIWTKEMTTWLHEIGFQELPTSVPEINVNYDDIPHN